MSEGVGGTGSGRTVGGRYRLGRMLGRGGMGAVWQAEDTLLARRVALKEVWLPSAGDDPMDRSDPVVRRVIREAQAAARLRHPGIITVHDVIEDAGRPWIVMELIDGRSLADVIAAQGLLSERQTAEVGLQVLDALRAAHREGVAHRDVKPANILLAEDRVVLTDFGIATIYDETALTATGQMVGSPAYLAPERINGMPATAASDLWALGVTLYTAVTGASPFQRDSTPATLMAVLDHRPATPAHAGRLWPLIKGLLDKDPTRRLNADQARTLLNTAIQRTDESDRAAGSPRPRVRLPFLRRNIDDPDTSGLPPTATAPAPTLADQTRPNLDDVAATTSGHGHGPNTSSTPVNHPWTADTPTAATPLPAHPGPATGTRRRWWPAAGITAAVVLALALAGTVLKVYYPDLLNTSTGTTAGPPGDLAAPSQTESSATASPATSETGQPTPSGATGNSGGPVTPDGTVVDDCLVGTWQSVAFSKKLKIRTEVFSVSGAKDVIRRIRPDGASTDDYTRATPLTATINGNQYAEIIRGTRDQQASTNNGVLTLNGIVSRQTLEITENGEQLPVTLYPKQSEAYPYTCSTDDLALNDGTTYETYERLSANPDMKLPTS
ncbi:MAG TPA: serine/threonine-protein kinase [Actinoplanes sp.]|nr:serine/threonine-protein kinase [Actinoplanes sp.]